MAMLVSKISPLESAEYFVFDLEVVASNNTLDSSGILKPAQCYIWDMCFIHLRTHAKFAMKVNPGLNEYPPPPNDDLFHVNKDYLEENNALPFSKVIPKFLDFINYFTQERPAVFIAHGTFLLDKPVLQLEFARAHCLMPNNFYFFDTLPMFRQKFRRQSSYSLKSLYRMCFKELPKEHHFAESDAFNLLKILMHACNNDIYNIEGCLCPAYLTPLQTVKFIGRQKEMLLFHAGITCLEELVIICAKQCRFNETLMSSFLQRVCSIERSSAMKVSRQLLFKVLTQF